MSFDVIQNISERQNQRATSGNAHVVDDDPASAAVVAKLLRALGCEVTSCIDPRTAVTLALSSDLDLVCLDLTMPGLDGYQVLSLIRSHEHSHRLPGMPVGDYRAR